MTPICLISLLILTIWQMLSLELGFDESYYWVYSQFLDWGYYDHPPLTALLIFLGSSFLKSEFFVRLPFFLMSCALFISVFPKVKLNEIVFLFSLPLIHSFMLALPDSALLIAILFFYYCLNKKNEWLMALSLSLLIYAKYHGVMFVLYFFLLIPFSSKKKIFILFLLMLTPHFLWQYSNDFITFGFLRSNHGQLKISFYRSLESILHVSLIFLMPLIILVRNKTRDHNSIFIAVIFLGYVVLSLFTTVELNWTSILIVPCFIVLRNHIILKRERVVGYTLFFIIFLIRLNITFPVFPIKRMSEFTQWKSIVNSIRGPVVAQNYQIASKFSFYSDKIVMADHKNARKSQFSLLKEKINIPDEFTYVSYDRLKNSTVIELQYKGPLHIRKMTKEEISP